MAEKLRLTQEGVPKEIEERFDTIRKKFSCGREQIEVFKKPAGFPDSRIAIAIKRSKGKRKGVWDIELNLTNIGKNTNILDDGSS